MAPKARIVLAGLVAFLIASTVLLPAIGSEAAMAASVTFTPSAELLAGGCRWAGGNSSDILFVNFYDNYLAHYNTDGASWGPWWDPGDMQSTTLSMVDLLNHSGFNVIRAGDIPENLSAYGAVMIFAYFACEPRHVPVMREYVENGGGLILLAGTADYFRCYCKDFWTWTLPTDPLSMNNSEWVGAETFMNSGGQAIIRIDHPFGTSFAYGDVVMDVPSSSLSAASGGEATMVAEWSAGMMFAYSHVFGEGRVYYQASFDLSKTYPNDDCGVSGQVMCEFGYPLSSAVAILDGNTSATCDDQGRFSFNALQAGSHQLLLSAQGFDDEVLSIELEVDEKLSIGQVVLSANNSKMGLITLVGSEGFSLLIPVSWSYQQDAEVGGEHEDLLLEGPVVDNFKTNVIVSSGYDTTLEIDQEHSWDFINYTLDELQKEGLSAYLLEGPTFKQVSKRSAMEFSIRYDSYAVTQQMVVILSESTHRYWIIILSSSNQAYPQVRPMFDQMVSSFEVTSDPDIIEGLLWLIVIGVIVAAIVLVAMVLFLRRRKNKGLSSQPSGAVGAPPGMGWTCPACDTPNKYGVFCSNCGRRRG
ncbi:MAG: carboxypeptidase-like regulatory domain-containing protein [Methanomassiliicoccales archaeon]|nr:carboxypeptidase-like regulatory domain-containing protein [Methanomassiliicoccales archaeon]